MYTHQEDVIYGRKYGTALTMDVFSPEQNGNGLGLIFAVSGGWVSGHEHIATLAPGLIEPLVRRGYTVFAVVPGSQPKYTIPEIILDMNRAVRYIRYHAPKFGIDSHRIGIYGGSAGGHLSLMVGLAGGQGNPVSDDAVERESSRVQAVCEFYAPTDFFNYGQEGASAAGCGILENYRAPFDFHNFDPLTGTFVPVNDANRIREIVRQISPISHATADSPPTLVIHGDQDLLVPLQQSQILVEKFEQVGVATRLIVRPGAAHGWDDRTEDMKEFADWFDEHLHRSTPVPDITTSNREPAAAGA